MCKREGTEEELKADEGGRNKKCKWGGCQRHEFLCGNAYGGHLRGGVREHPTW